MVQNLKDSNYKIDIGFRITEENQEQIKQMFNKENRSLGKTEEKPNHSY